jgi:hypothetical protein
MDQEIRNKLRNVVTQCRRLLEEAITQELEGKYSIFAKKDQVTADPHAEMKNLTTQEDRDARKDILDHFEHIKARGFKPKGALEHLIREVAFTHLNRLCAYKMMEAREVYVGGQKFREAVSRGVNSNGVKFYLADHEEDERLFNTGYQDIAYRRFLDWLGGQLSEEIGVLFNPNDPANRLYPRQNTLDEVLELLNYGAIRPEETTLRQKWPQIWSQDETIGWVYQFFTPKELRDSSRDVKKGGSLAPRNSYELAFRNQFFTPRYVVEFLTDNALGRIWYEMRKGQTKLKEQCRYMVRRPTEVFLKEGEQPPKDSAEGKNDLSQEELLKLPVFFTHRPKKDPRELKILDPACGSGHFLLYCFDLLMTIYEEAYADPDLGPALKKDYPTLDSLKRDAPRLILAHNLHGIDIDLRASQIAALALWLRCQRASTEMGLKQERPRINRSNFVCAEPMPGEAEVLQDFITQLEPRILGQVVEAVFRKMNLAGEAGSLLKIEVEIREVVASAKHQYIQETTRAIDRKGRTLLFSEAEMERLAGKPVQPSLFDFTDITDEQFFDHAESKVIEALRAYSEKAQSQQKLQRRLFEEDTVRGFAFVDLCQFRYDIVLMNPPFGSATPASKKIVFDNYPKSKSDLFAAFVERGFDFLTPDGLCGCITSNSFLNLSSLEELRQLMLTDFDTSVVANFGYEVMDDATVPAACTILGKASLVSKPSILFIDAKDVKSREVILLSHNTDKPLNGNTVGKATLNSFPQRIFAYWLSQKLRVTFKDSKCLGELSHCQFGLHSHGHDDELFRTWWEVPASERFTTDWPVIKLGGDPALFYKDSYYVMDWRGNGERIREIASKAKGGTLLGQKLYFRSGLSYLYVSRTTVSVHPLEGRSIFSAAAHGCFPSDAKDQLLYLGFLNSEPVRLLLKVINPDRFFQSNYVRLLPVPELKLFRSRLESATTGILNICRSHSQGDECSRHFVSDWVSIAKLQHGRSLTSVRTMVTNACARFAELKAEVDSVSAAAYGFGPDDMELLSHHIGKSTAKDYPGDQDLLSTQSRAIAESHVSYLLGCALGRWDIGYSLQLSDHPSLQDPFEVLPAIPTGSVRLKQQKSASSELADFCNKSETNHLLVDDSESSEDVKTLVRQAMELIWGERAESTESELCEILGLNSLNEYFRKPSKGGFWDDHIARYSKSRRKAPIYWLLQSTKKNYAIWLYYHRLDKDLLFKALVNYVEPKIRLETSRVESLRSQKAEAGNSGKEAKRFAKDVEKQEDFLSELRDFEDKLRRAANLNLEPDLNDGVVLNIAPLWELVPWKEAKKYWNELMEGQYEWSSISKQLRQKGLVK